MKEKTFEELIEPLREKYIFHNGVDLGVLYEEDVLELLKQVREATIAECKEQIWNEYGLYKKAHEIRTDLENLPSDTIKTDL